MAKSDFQYSSIADFLLAVGYHRSSELIFKYKHCEVEITGDGYIVSWDSADDPLRYNIFSENHSIFWLIGALTYHRLMPKEQNLLAINLDLF